MRKAISGLAAVMLSVTAGMAFTAQGVADDLPTTVPVHIFSFNDFHGRIVPDGTNAAGAIAWAYTLEKAVLADPDNSMVVSAGDNVGASQFQSAITHDDPTIQLLDDIAATPGINFKASAVGNHEFDQGLADLQQRIIGGINADGTPAPVKANWTYLGANVLSKATGEPVLDPYYVYTLGNGLRVGVVGAVTQETPTLVSPAGISTLEFTDPVAAVNKYADQLKAQDLADIVVAVYHEGAPVATSLADAMADSTTFSNIVNGTDANVDAIVNGHTHMAYAWVDPTGRPIVQAGSYSNFVGRIDLTVDTTTMKVTAASDSVIPSVAADQVDLSLGSMQTISDHVTAAIAQANVLGQQPIGRTSGDVTTAFTAGVWQSGTYQNTGSAVRDDRANESTLGTLVANAFLDAADMSAIGGADIGIINAGGGLRAELLYGTDGTITYAAANSVVPFANNVWTIELTGAQFKQFLEEQWRVTPDSAPSRPFLATGVSSNVTYTVNTDQPGAMACTLADKCAWDDKNSHITSVFIDGQPLDPQKTYKIITISFLTAGGDNYLVMNEGTNAQDTGLLDRDVWINYLQNAGTVSPSFARPSVVVSNLMPQTAPMAPIVVAAGSSVTASLSRLDMTSLGSPANTTLETYLGTTTDTSSGVLLSTTSVTAPGDVEGCAAAGVPDSLNPDSNGCAKMNVTIPATTSAGTYILTSIALPSKTMVYMQITVTAAPTGPTIQIPGGGHVASGSLVPSAVLFLVAGVVLTARRLS